ncbi:hypothetical protein IE077_002346 [Cardiosporidium cionae]|uniref:Uncharacterized protein n=1 Tax=Cardiosporidium cionae TaxID=476202 RepID=A0ABQ7JFV7_9APIC|nr:hypothetical protein IE077_002346 [Cardiosporidium cionae]|eukprot:KAF8822858.1 hypothetical protein IE077_002346 [Cardiosporidium cionae]
MFASNSHSSGEVTPAKLPNGRQKPETLNRGLGKSTVQSQNGKESGAAGRVKFMQKIGKFAKSDKIAEVSSFLSPSPLKWNIEASEHTANEKKVIAAELARLSDLLPKIYDEKDMLARIGRATRRNEDSVYDPFRWLKQIAEDSKISSLSARISQQLQEFRENMEYLKLDEAPATDREFYAYLDYSKRKEDPWNLTLLEKVYGRHKVCTDYPTNLRNKRILINLFMPFCGFCGGIAASYIPFLSWNLPDFFMNPLQSITVGALTGLSFGWKLSKLSWAVDQTTPRTAMLGEWLTSRENPTLMEFIQFGVDCGIKRSQMQHYSNEIFSQVMFTAVINLNDSQMWMNEKAQLLHLKESLSISYSSLLSILDNVCNQFILNYQIPRGYSYIDGMKWLGSSNIRGKFIDKILYFVEALFSSDKHWFSLATRHISTLLHVKEERLKQHLYNITGEGYTSLLQEILSIDETEKDEQSIQNAIIHLQAAMPMLAVQRQKLHQTLYLKYIATLFGSTQDTKDIYRLSQKYRKKMDKLLHLLTVDKYWAKQQLQRYMISSFQKRLHSYIEALDAKTLTADEVATSIVTDYDVLQISQGNLLTQLLVSMRRQVNDLKQRTLRFQKLNNRPMAIDSAYHILYLYRVLPSLVTKLPFKDKETALMKLKTCFKTTETTRPVLDQLTLKELTRLLLDDQLKLSNSPWNSEDLQAWGEATGLSSTDVEKERMNLCQYFVEGTLLGQMQDFLAKNGGKVWNETHAHRRSLEQRNGPLKQLAQKWQFSLPQMDKITKDIYAEKLISYCSHLRLPTPSEWENLSQIRSFLGLSAENVSSLHALHCRGTFEKAVEESFGTEGHLSQFVKDELEGLSRWLLISEKDAHRIRLSAYHSFFQKQIVPSLEIQLDKILLPPAMFARKYQSRKDKEKNSFNDETHPVLGFTTHSDFLSHCINLIDLYEENGLIKHTSPSTVSTVETKISSHPSYWVSFSIGDLVNPSFLSSAFDQFLMLAVTEKPGVKREKYMQSIPKLATIFGFSETRQQEALISIGNKLYSRCLEHAFETKNSIDTDERNILKELEEEFHLNSVLCTKLVKETKEKKLKTILSLSMKDPTDPWPPGLGNKLLKAAQTLSIDALSTLQLSAKTLENWFCTEVKEWIKQRDIIDEACLEKINELQKILRFDVSKRTTLLKALADTEIQHLCGSAVKNMHEDNYEEVTVELSHILKYLLLKQEGSSVDFESLQKKIKKRWDIDDLTGLVRIFESKVFEDEEIKKSDEKRLKTY